MEESYLSQIEDGHIRDRLLTRDNIVALEDLLDRESQKLQRLQRLKRDRKLDFGKKLSSKELKELFPNVCAEVNDFLGIQTDEMPGAGYFNLFRIGLAGYLLLPSYAGSASLFMGSLIALAANPHPSLANYLCVGLGVLSFAPPVTLTLVFNSSGYNFRSKSVFLKKDACVNLIPVAGHEYTHFIQQIKGVPTKHYSFFEEGHARGVEKQIAEAYREREDNEAFLYDVTDLNVGEYKSAYIWLCERLGQEIKQSLLKTKTTRDSEEGSSDSKKREPTPHAIGNALFSIFEAQEGRGIYAKLISGEYEF